MSRIVTSIAILAVSVAALIAFVHFDMRADRNDSERLRQDIEQLRRQYGNE